MGYGGDLWRPDLELSDAAKHFMGPIRCVFLWRARGYVHICFNVMACYSTMC